MQVAPVVWIFFYLWLHSMTATRALYEQVSVPNDVSGPRLEKASHPPPPTQPARPLTEPSRSQRTGCGKLLSFASAADRRVNDRHTLQAWRHRAEPYGTLQDRTQEKGKEHTARLSRLRRATSSSCALLELLWYTINSRWWGTCCFSSTLSHLSQHIAARSGGVTRNRRWPRGPSALGSSHE